MRSLSQKVDKKEIKFLIPLEQVGVFNLSMTGNFIFLGFIKICTVICRYGFAQFTKIQGLRGS